MELDRSEKVRRNKRTSKIAVAYFVVGAVLSATVAVRAPDPDLYLGIFGICAFFTLFSAGILYTAGRWVDDPSRVGRRTDVNWPAGRSVVLILASMTLLLGVAGGIADPATWRCGTDCSADGLAFGLVVGGVALGLATKVGAVVADLWLFR